MECSVIQEHDEEIRSIASRQAREELTCSGSGQQADHFLCDYHYCVDLSISRSDGDAEEKTCEGEAFVGCLFTNSGMNEHRIHRYSCFLYFEKSM